jgi:hypothetical protein
LLRVVRKIAIFNFQQINFVREVNFPDDVDDRPNLFGESSAVYSILKFAVSIRHSSFLRITVKIEGSMYVTRAEKAAKQCIPAGFIGGIPLAVKLVEASYRLRRSTEALNEQAFRCSQATSFK